MVADQHPIPQCLGEDKPMDIRGVDSGGGGTTTEWSPVKYDRNEWLMDLIGIALVAVIIIWAVS